MSIVASIHGRVLKAPSERTTKTGKAMTIASCAVDVAGRDDTEQQTLWVSLMCFGDQAAALAKVQAGESVSAFGRMTRGTWTNQAGESRESWTMLCDGLVAVRSARPGQRKGTNNDRGASAPSRARWESKGDDLAF